MQDKLNDIRQTDINKTIEGPAAGVESDTQSAASIRVSPHSYLTALFLGTFVSAFLFYIEIDLAGFLAFGLSWILIPFFALNDRISFDGKRLIRTGVGPSLWAWLNGSRRRLKLSDVEQVETEAIRAMKRGGNVYYRYRTMIRGKGLGITISSGGEDFRRMLKGILPKLADNILDTRSIELRDHLTDPKEALMRADFAHIPSAEVLENSFRTAAGRLRSTAATGIEGSFDEKAENLRSLANELRVSGYFLQALEAFRRALVLRPRDGRILFEFARCLHSFAGVERDQKLERRALAALRLSERHASNDGDLLVRLGEWYFQIGEWRRAGHTFHCALDTVGDNFRTARGLAEIALREGKIAHVIHHFATANRVAEIPSLRRWSKTEADYFSNLNADEEYMELEISRVNMLDTVESSRKTSLRITFLGLPAILFGVVFEDALVANIGWAVSTLALLIWAGLIVFAHMLSQRIPYDLIESDD